MKLTLALAALVSLLTASAVAHEQWVVNDHRRERALAKIVKPAEDTSFPCARWDGPRCLDDEEKPSPFAEEFRKRPTPEAEKAEARRIIEETGKAWEAHHAQLKEMKKAGRVFSPLDDVIDLADIDAGTDADA